jgi:Spy/CpxP family protein refolding chaperone
MLTRIAGSMLAIAAAATLVAAPPARADQAAGTPGSPAVHRHLQEKLGLSPEQTQAIQAIRARHRDQWRQIAPALRQSKQELRHLALNGGDPSAIEAKRAQVAQLMEESLRLRTAALQEIAPILTEQQRQQMEQLGHGRRGPGA